MRAAGQLAARCPNPRGGRVFDQASGTLCEWSGSAPLYPESIFPPPDLQLLWSPPHPIGPRGFAGFSRFARKLALPTAHASPSVPGPTCRNP